MATIQREDPHDRQLALLSKASIALMEAKSLSDIKNVRDKAEAVRHYAKSIALGLEMHNHAAEIKLRAERKAGALLASLPLHGGDRKSRRHSEILTLKQFGIDGNQSSRWQKEAAVPEEEFQRYINEANAAQKEISAAGLLALANNCKSSGRRSNSKTRSTANDDVGTDRRRRVDHADAGTRIVADSDESVKDIVQEAKDHLSLLTKLLEPVCNHCGARLTVAECNHIRQLLLNIERALKGLRSIC